MGVRERYRLWRVKRVEGLVVVEAVVVLVEGGGEGAWEEGRRWVC